VIAGAAFSEWPQRAPTIRRPILNEEPAMPSRLTIPVALAAFALLTSAAAQEAPARRGFQAQQSQTQPAGEQQTAQPQRRLPADSVTKHTVTVAGRTLDVIIAHGLTDLVTPYFESQLLIDQLPPFVTPERVRLLTYGGGHMFYSRDASRAAFRRDVAALYERAAARWR
jgi:carboxypeptidase C (cathepsin A)